MNGDLIMGLGKLKKEIVQGARIEKRNGEIYLVSLSSRKWADSLEFSWKRMI